MSPSYTPTGTVSVRGGIALIKIDGDTVTAVFLHGDHMSMTSHGVTQTTNHRNTVIISTGGHARGPTTATAELIQELTQELQALHLTTYTVGNEIVVTGDTLASLINLILPVVPNATSTEPNFIPHSPPPRPWRFITAAASTVIAAGITTVIAAAASVSAPAASIAAAAGVAATTGSPPPHHRRRRNRHRRSPPPLTAAASRPSPS